MNDRKQITVKLVGQITPKPDYNGTSKATGKPYTLHSWDVEADLNGRVCWITIKTMSKYAMELVKPGATLTVEEDVRNGNVTYYLPAPPKEGGGWSGKGGGGGYSRKPDCQYTRAQLKQVYADCYDDALDILGPETESEYVIAATATLFIQSTRCGIGATAEAATRPATSSPVSAPAPAQDRAVQGTPDPLQAITEWCGAAGKTEAVVAAGLNRGALRQMYTDVHGDRDEFLARLEVVLDPKAGAASTDDDDALPF